MLSFRNLRVLIILAACTLVLSGCDIPFRQKAVSGLQITTEGIPASVSLNGNKVNSTPYSDQELEPGTYTVRLEPESSDLAAYETSVTLYPGTLAVMNWHFGENLENSGGIIYEMEPGKKKKESSLSISSIPDGAIVKVDEVSQGFTPVLMKSMTAGSHRFEVSLPSYKTIEETANIVDGFQMNISVKLAKEKTSEVDSASDSAEASSSATATSSAKNKEKDVSSTASSSSTAKNTSTTSGSSIKIVETGTGWLRVRETPSASGKELGKVDVGETFEFSDTKNGWYEIEYEKGKSGWVSGQYVKEVK